MLGSSLIDQHTAPTAAPTALKISHSWATSKVKVILIRMHMGRKHWVHDMSPDEFYKIHPEFQLYLFARFKENLKSLRAAVKRENKIIRGSKHDYLHDELHCPRKERTSRGVHFWDTYPANLLLQHDLKDVKEGKKAEQLPSKLRMTRKEYQDFSVKIFCGHVHQEKRNQREE